MRIEQQVCRNEFQSLQKEFCGKSQELAGPIFRDYQVSIKDCLLLQQEGVPGPLRHHCQAHTHHQPSVKGEPSPERNDSFMVL